MDDYKDLIVYAVQYLLDAQLTEDGGWSEDDIQKLKEIETGKFEINLGV